MEQSGVTSQLLKTIADSVEIMTQKKEKVCLLFVCCMLLLLLLYNIVSYLHLTTNKTNKTIIQTNKQTKQTNKQTNKTNKPTETCRTGPLCPPLPAPTNVTTINKIPNATIGFIVVGFANGAVATTR
jgi:hypothetical protein